MYQPYFGFWLFAWSRCGRIVKKSNTKDVWYQDYSVLLTSAPPSCHQPPSAFVPEIARNVKKQAASIFDPKRCKNSSVGQSAGLLIRRSSVRFRQKLKKKTENSNLYGFEIYRPSNKGTKLLLQVTKAIINQLKEP